METKRKRVDRLRADLEAQKEAARVEVLEWWKQFSDAELHKIADGEEAATELLYLRGYDRIKILLDRFGDVLLFKSDAEAETFKDVFVFENGYIVGTIEDGEVIPVER